MKNKPVMYNECVCKTCCKPAIVKCRGREKHSVGFSGKTTHWPVMFFLAIRSEYWSLFDKYQFIWKTACPLLEITTECTNEPFSWGKTIGKISYKQGKQSHQDTERAKEDKLLTIAVFIETEILFHIKVISDRKAEFKNIWNKCYMKTYNPKNH